MKNIITICGPTGIGKTGFAIYLAKQFNGEIIGADSMQIYKYMDIGTAKPDTSERAEACHHLVDFLDPAKEFDAGQYAKMADEAIDIITHKKDFPLWLAARVCISGPFYTACSAPGRCAGHPGRTERNP